VIRRGWIVVLGLVARTMLGQAPSVVVREPGPGPEGQLLARVLAKPDTRILIADSVAITADSVFPATVVVIGKRVAVSTQIHGDLIVVGGDLFMKPGAQIFGQAIAFGGAVYPSLLASARDGAASYRDFTFDVTRSAGVVELRYRELLVMDAERAFQLPGIYGVGIPTYDRSNGLSLPFGPSLLLDRGRLTVDPMIAYRSQIGQFDPSVTVDWRPGRALSLHAVAARETRTNDAWITGELSNSLNSFLIGRDTRNWYRARRIEAHASRLFETPALTSTYRLGGQIEDASSARPDSSPTGGPWSLTGKTSVEGMWRPNPQIAGGRITSVIGGASYQWRAADVKSILDLAVDVPMSTADGSRFVQLTLDGQIGFPTFGLQTYRFDAHAILTRGDTAPAQRFGYIGGSGTLATIEPLLSIGGDELIFLESRYIVPVPAVKIPFVGSPTVTFRHILGSAGVQRLPDLTQIVGLRLSVMLVRAEFLIDTRSRKTELNAGLSLVR
jgi:hypothetical protein